MDTVGVRELQQHASSVVRRVQRGEVIGVTERGRMVAVMQPVAAATGAAALVAAGRVRQAVDRDPVLPAPVARRQRSAEVLDGIRAERG